jgi:protein gp37
MAKSTIEWTDYTWNTITGCNRVSEGCRFCYAEQQSPLLKARYLGIARKAADRQIGYSFKLLALPSHLHNQILNYQGEVMP